MAVNGHPYQSCRDQGCERPYCQIWREAWREGWQEGHRDGYREGYGEGFAAGAASAERT